MTNQLIMTTAQRDALIEALNTHPDFDTQDLISEAVGVLQSLPVVQGEPVAYLAHYYIEPTIHTEADDGFDVVEPTTETAFPVFTSPQALAPITAADVTDEMVLVYYADFPYLKDKPILLQGAKNDLVAAYNLVAAHLVKPRSEAR